jgi:outer membrane protein OmpA-like peptidoglycan-associated protein
VSAIVSAQRDNFRPDELPAKPPPIEFLTENEFSIFRSWEIDGVPAPVTGEYRFLVRNPQNAERQIVVQIAREVIAIVGDGSSPPRLFASLDGMTAVVTGVPDALQDAAWQADLLQGGASRVFVLDQADETGLSALVADGLNGAGDLTFPLARVHYGPAQYALSPGARPALRRLLDLLSVSYPDATATINGYTDSIPTPGGNLALSWHRAAAVLAWLTHRGISASRLQAVGHGSADPVAPNRPGGQPLNRRVIVIITP